MRNRQTGKSIGWCKEGKASEQAGNRWRTFLDRSISGKQPSLYRRNPRLTWEHFLLLPFWNALDRTTNNAELTVVNSCNAWEPSKEKARGVRASRQAVCRSIFLSCSAPCCSDVSQHKTKPSLLWFYKQT